MTLREAYFYITEGKLKAFIREKSDRVNCIRFMLDDHCYIEVPSDKDYCMDRILNVIKGEIITRYLKSSILGESYFYFYFQDVNQSYTIY